MKKTHIILFGFFMLSACGGTKSNANEVQKSTAKLSVSEFHEKAKAACQPNVETPALHYLDAQLVRYQQCMVSYYEARMGKEVERNQLAEANKKRMSIKLDLMKNRRKLVVQRPHNP